MLRRNGPVIKSMESVLRPEGSLWWERFVKKVAVFKQAAALLSILLHYLVKYLTPFWPTVGSGHWPSCFVRPCINLFTRLCLYAAAEWHVWNAMGRVQHSSVICAPPAQPHPAVSTARPHTRLRVRGDDACKECLRCRWNHRRISLSNSIRFCFLILLLSSL